MTDFWELEADLFVWELEDGTGNWLLEAAADVPDVRINTQVLGTTMSATLTEQNT